MFDQFVFDIVRIEKPLVQDILIPFACLQFCFIRKEHCYRLPSRLCCTIIAALLIGTACAKCLYYLFCFFWFSIYPFTVSRETLPTEEMNALLVQIVGIRELRVGSNALILGVEYRFRTLTQFMIP